MLGDRDREVVGPFGDADHDVVALFDPCAPADEHLGVLAYAFTHNTQVEWVGEACFDSAIWVTKES
ncbi:hypothetical protein GCM10008995_03760 [Halobellus salinus]|uniref:Uncharacterized protein n=1 Tax=Halobellus salinus TaxID=931585 RepID=A0A830E7D1_9EURY|nr:hypothetical protein GCM10008995_03760 [Halobellus salinus]